MACPWGAPVTASPPSRVLTFLSEVSQFTWVRWGLCTARPVSAAEALHWCSGARRRRKLQRAIAHAASGRSASSCECLCVTCGVLVSQFGTLRALQRSRPCQTSVCQVHRKRAPGILAQRACRRLRACSACACAAAHRLQAEAFLPAMPDVANFMRAGGCTGSQGASWTPARRTRARAALTAQ